MKNLSLRCTHMLLAAITLLMPLAAHAQTSDQSPVELPKIVFETLEHDFGTTKPNNRLAHSFIFTNQGTAPLIIEKVKAG